CVWGLFVEKSRVHPQTWAGSSSIAAEASSHGWLCPHQHPWSPLLYRGERRTMMLTHPTLDKFQTLKLSGMYHALVEQLQMADIAALSFEERFGLLVDRELTERDTRRLTTRLRQAK